MARAGGSPKTQMSFSLPSVPFPLLVTFFAERRACIFGWREERAQQGLCRWGGRQVCPLPYASTESAARTVQGMGYKPTPEYEHPYTSISYGRLAQAQAHEHGLQHAPPGSGETGWFPPPHQRPCQVQVLHGQPACITRCCLSLLRACLGARLRTWGGVVTRGQANGHLCKSAPAATLTSECYF